MLCDFLDLHSSGNSVKISLMRVECKNVDNLFKDDDRFYLDERTTVHVFFMTLNVINGFIHNHTVMGNKPADTIATKIKYGIKLAY